MRRSARRNLNLVGWGLLCPVIASIVFSITPKGAIDTIGALLCCAWAVVLVWEVESAPDEDKNFDQKLVPLLFWLVWVVASFFSLGSTCSTPDSNFIGNGTNFPVRVGTLLIASLVYAKIALDEVEIRLKRN